MAFPATPLPVKVELALGADLTADSATWTWTDITTYVRESDKIVIKYGRSDYQGQAEPSSLSLTLDNTGGRFVPRNPTGAYYGSIGRNTPIRVSVDGGSGYVARYTGYVAEWPPRWDVSGNDKYVQVEANGLLRRLGQNPQPVRSALYKAITSSPVQPGVYWPLEDSVKATSVTSGLVGGSPMAVTNPGIALESESSLPASAALPDFSGGGRLKGQVKGVSGDRTCIFVVKCPEGAGALWPIIVLRTNDTPSGDYVVQVTAAGVFQLYAYDTYPSGTPSLVTSVTPTVSPFGGDWFQIWVALTQSGGNVNAALTVVQENAIPVSPGTAIIASQTLGNVSSVEINPTASTSAGVVGHLAVYDGNYAQEFDELQHGDAFYGYNGETAYNRISRLSREEGVPTTLVVNGGAQEVTEDFEDAFLNFTITGTWARNNTQSHSGSWSFKSATIGDGATTDAVVTIPANATTMSFFYNVSAEPNFDFFYLLLDGAQKFAASDVIGWSAVSIDVTGYSQATFRYQKDVSVSAGLDAVFIDDLTFHIDDVVMGPQTVDTYMNLIQESETTDIGLLYETTTGRLGYIPRIARYNSPVHLALDYDQGHVAPPFEPTDDDRDTANDWTVARKFGSRARVTDPGHIAQYGRYTAQKTINVVDLDLVLENQAGWLLHLGTSDELRYPRVRLNLASNPSFINSWLQCEAGCRITIANPPPELPPDPIDLFIDGYTETISPYEWLVDMNCSPAKPWDVAVSDNTVLGRIDSGSSTLTSSVTNSATSFSVTTADAGDLWTTSGAQFPLPILVGGEKMTVSAIASAVRDTFSRTVSNGWGTSDSGHLWTTSGGSASDFSTNASSGAQSNGTINALRHNLIDISSTDGTIRFDVDIPVVPTGAPITVWAVLRAANTSNYYSANLSVATSGAVTLSLNSREAGVLTNIASAVPVGQHSGGDDWRVVFKVSGLGQLMAKAWKLATDVEPGWQIAATNNGALATGIGTLAGVLSRLETGNTNALPVVLRYDNFASLSPQTFTISARSVNGVVKSHSSGTEVHVAQPAVLAL